MFTKTLFDFRVWLRPSLAAAFCALAVSCGGAQDQNGEPRPKPSGESGKQSEPLKRWRYFAEVASLPSADTPWYDCLVTPQVFDAARLDLADLRLYDAGGVEIPFALRVRREESQLANIEAEEFNRLTTEDGVRQVSLDLGEEQVQHNEVEVLTPGINFRRPVVVEGSDDRKAWHELADNHLLSYQSNGREFVDATVDYAPSRFRYVRVSVRPDPQEDTDGKWQLRSVNVRRRVQIPGEQVTREVKFRPREPVRTRQGPGSQWLIELGGAGVPVAELLVEIDSDDFVRDWQVESAGPDRPGEEFRHVAAGTWQRKAGQEKQTFVAQLPEEVRAARLKLLVTDYRNPPLSIESIRTRAPARQVVFEAGPNKVQGPLRLYFGNPDAEAPRYDFARNLPRQLDPAPKRLELGVRQPNPGYQPAPKPLTERLPWLVHSVLAGSVATLGLLIVSLARAAMRQDAAPAAKADEHG